MQPLASDPNAASGSSEPTSPTSNRFHSTLSSDEDWIEYRVTASGASTAWHRLTTQPRPAVELFEIELTPPSYAGCPTVVEKREYGHIRGLIGSRVRMSLQLNQLVKLAELKWQSPSDTGTTHEPLVFHHDSKTDRYVTEFEVNRSDTFVFTWYRPQPVWPTNLALLTKSKPSLTNRLRSPGPSLPQINKSLHRGNCSL